MTSKYLENPPFPLLIRVLASLIITQSVLSCWRLLTSSGIHDLGSLSPSSVFAAAAAALGLTMTFACVKLTPLLKRAGDGADSEGGTESWRFFGCCVGLLDITCFGWREIMNRGMQILDYTVFESLVHVGLVTVFLEVATGFFACLGP